MPLPDPQGRVEQAPYGPAQDAAIDGAIDCIGFCHDAFHLGRIARFQNGHVRDRAHDRDIFDRLMGHPARCGDPRQEPHQLHFAARKSDGGHQLIIGPAIQEHPETVQEGADPGQTQAPCKRQYVLFRHPE